MNRKQARHSSIFLLELMIAILFFCLSAGVCIRLFAKAHVMGEESENLSMALSQTSEIIEVFRAEDTLEGFLSKEFPEYESGGNEEYTLFYDSEWKPCSRQEAQFSMTISIVELGSKNQERGTFSMNDMVKGTVIYSTNMDKYTGEAVK